ncbi:hypothetical protein GF357_00255 [Candidatus Dojkabacteria bacterium]|nr:hypothetical protein [Candidatus Dojkabacteria bacterium]
MQDYFVIQIKSHMTQRQSPHQQLEINFKIVLYLFGGIFTAILVLMFRWQVLEHEKWTTRAQEQYVSDQRPTGSRGVVYASDNSVLAIDEPAWGIYASLSSDENERKVFFNGKSKFVDTVSEILEINPGKLDAKLTPDFRYVNIAHGIDTEKKKLLEETEIFTAQDLQEYGISPVFAKGYGLYFEKEEKRIYPDGRLGSHILGFVGKNEDGEDIGQYGVEGYYFGDMAGQQGYTYEEKDSHGNVILTVEYEPILPRTGKNIYLTIEPGIQSKVERVLKENVNKHKAKSGTAVVMDVKTGKILAMANYPDFDPNQYWLVSDPWIYKNRAVSDVYEPGSVQKPVTLAIALETESIDEDYFCVDDDGYIEVLDKKLYTWDLKADGRMDLAGILANSNNPCIAEIGLKTGLETFYPKLLEFGYGSFVGLGLQDETTSYILPYDYWTKVDLAAIAFGQGISATPIQIIGALNTIANDGKRMKPYIVSKIEDENETIEFGPTVLSEPISKDTADKVTTMMESVVREGETKNWFNKYLPEYDIAGKTGTAQIAKLHEAGYYEDRMNTTFIGFAPADDPKAIILVKMEEPQSSTYAVLTAAPTWVEIFQEIADDLGIEGD